MTFGLKSLACRGSVLLKISLNLESSDLSVEVGTLGILYHLLVTRPERV